MIKYALHQVYICIAFEYLRNRCTCCLGEVILRCMLEREYIVHMYMHSSIHIVVFFNYLVSASYTCKPIIASWWSYGNMHYVIYISQEPFICITNKTLTAFRHTSCSVGS